MTGFAIGFLSLSLKKDSGEVVTCVAWLVALAWVAACGAPWLAKNLQRVRAEALTVLALFAAALALRLALRLVPPRLHHAAAVTQCHVSAQPSVMRQGRALGVRRMHCGHCDHSTPRSRGKVSTA